MPEPPPDAGKLRVWRTGAGGRRAAASLAVEDLFGQRAARLFVR
jgi:hypothetical protein